MPYVCICICPTPDLDIFQSAASPLYLACEKGPLEIVQYMVDHGADAKYIFKVRSYNVIFRVFAIVHRLLKDKVIIFARVSPHSSSYFIPNIVEKECGTNSFSHSQDQFTCLYVAAQSGLLCISLRVQ